MFQTVDLAASEAKTADYTVDGTFAVTPENDLLVLDVGMRPVDGLTFLDGVRAIPGYNYIPAIALTGYASEKDRLRFLAAGFQAVVTKPILDRQDLESVVETWCNTTGLT